MRRLSWWLLFLGAVAGCARVAPSSEPGVEGWTDESFHLRRGRCSTSQCRLTIRSPDSRFAVVERWRTYSRHDIPGWEVPKGERRTNAVAGWLFRGAGGSTNRVQVTIGSYAIISPADSTLRMDCSYLSITDQEIAHNTNDVDEVTQSRVLTKGLDCRVFAAPDTSRTFWRYRYGIAPRRDSLAALHDSLAALKSPDVGVSPPIVLERLAVDSAAPATFTVGHDNRTLQTLLRGATLTVARQSGVAVATIEIGIQIRLRVAPDATADERQILRLVAMITALAP